jgi:TRAP-type uncharacterized transport system fused permease subunit
MRERGHMFIPVLAILVFMYTGFSAPMAALAGVSACFPVAALRKSTRHYVTLGNIIGACADGARNALPVAAACAAAGVVIAVVTLSGLGIVFTQFVVHLSQNYLLPALMLTMLAGIVLGMGMPTTPAYIIMTALLVPAIVKFGVLLPAAHMFALSCLRSRRRWRWRYSRRRGLRNPICGRPVSRPCASRRRASLCPICSFMRRNC